MSSFEYEALNRQGDRLKGIIAADSARGARKELRQQNLAPLNLTQTQVKDRKLVDRISFEFTPRVSNGDLTLFARQLATMLDAGAPLEGAMQTLAQQADKPHLRRILSQIRSDVAEGYTFAAALERQGKAFSPFFVALVGAGEASGSLAQVMDRLAIHLERSHDIRNKVITACVYPSALALTAIIVVALLITLVVPKVVEQFDSLDQALPGLTLVVIGISDFLQSYGLLLVVGMLAAGAAFAKAMAVHHVRMAIDRFVLHLPVFGRLTRGLHTARLARTLSTLISCGTPVVEGLRAATATIGNHVLRTAIEEVTRKVSEGSDLSSALKSTGIFPPLLVYMSAIGEGSGRLDTMLSKVADHLEGDFETTTKAALSLLEPLIIIVMGGVVATIVLAILLPILRLNALALM